MRCLRGARLKPFFVLVVTRGATWQLLLLPVLTYFVRGAPALASPESFQELTARVSLEC